MTAYDTPLARLSSHPPAQARTGTRAPTDPYGLNRHTLYRIPAVSVSYHPELANRRVWWTGARRELPADGGRMDLFRFAECDRPPGHGETVWLRPSAPVKDTPTPSDTEYRA